MPRRRGIVLIGAQHHTCMLIDANHVEKRPYKTVNIPELHMAALRFAAGHPIQDAACRREVHTDEPGAGDDEAPSPLQAGLQLEQRVCRVAHNLAGQLDHGSGHLFHADGSRQGLVAFPAQPARGRCIRCFAATRARVAEQTAAV